MRDKFEIEISKEFKDVAIINYGIINGNNKIVFIKAGQDGSLYGYENKYLRMADRLNKKYNCSVICSSNPFEGNNPLDNAMEVIEEYASKFDDYEIYYLGYSNGGLIGLWFGTQYDKIKKIISVNAPLMYNYHKTKKGITDYKGDKIVLVYGEYDQSINYVPLLENISQPKLIIDVIKGEDHHISKDMEHFFEIPEKYFFNESSESDMEELMKITNENIDKINIEVQKTINYGKEADIIHEILNQFPLNNDLNTVAMKIAVIDVTNSTHLSQYKSKISLYELAEVIINIPDFDERVKKGDPELVNIIARNNDKVNLFSLASKYCTYHNVEIYGNDHYSIFDSVVKEMLPKYRPDVTKYTLEKWRRNYDYESFNKCIEAILDEHNITTKNRRRKFDHFLWYPNR